MLSALLLVGAVCLLCAEAMALIEVAEGNRPVGDAEWPLGVLGVANLPERVGHWAGTRGGGLYAFLYRSSSTKEFNEALRVFAAIRAPTLELVVNDGPEYSFALKREGRPEEAARVDWTFTVWVPESWYRLHNNPRLPMFYADPNFGKPVPPPRLDVYIGGGSLVWDQIEIPENLRVIDKRDESAPIKPVGGGLVRGTVYDMATGKPVVNAEVVLTKTEEGEVLRRTSDGLGAFQIEKIPAGTYEVTVQAEGFAARTLGRYKNRANTYQEFVVELARAATIVGTVAGTGGKPVSGVKVSASHPLAINGRRYSGGDSAVVTDEHGRFAIWLPRGYTMLRCRTPGFYYSSMSKLFEVPSKDVTIVMVGTGTIHGKVVGASDKAQQRGLYVHVVPVGETIGKWGGSMRCGKDGTFEFAAVPPGEYWITTKPGPVAGEEDPTAARVSVKSGETVEMEITAR